ncbi:MAG: hypothetical protein F6K55_04835 [Moorea sp. SIO4A3]|nr:hypothetical protein [Moorena sp. SIO4A3]
MILCKPVAIASPEFCLTTNPMQCFICKLMYALPNWDSRAYKQEQTIRHTYFDVLLCLAWQ